MLNEIRDQFNHYYQQLPTQIPRAAATSAICVFAVKILFIPCTCINPELAVLYGVVAATATVVSGVTMPIFRQICDRQNHMNWGEHSVNIILSIAITQGLFHAFTPYRVNVLENVWSTILANLLYYRWADHSTTIAHSIIA